MYCPTWPMLSWRRCFVYSATLGGSSGRSRVLTASRMSSAATAWRASESQRMAVIRSVSDLTFSGVPQDPDAILQTAESLVVKNVLLSRIQSEYESRLHWTMWVGLLAHSPGIAGADRR